MVDRSDVERFRKANAALSQSARDDLETFFKSLNLSKPVAARNALLEFVPILTEEHGAAAATLAADWYEELRSASGAVGRFSATAAGSVPDASVQAKVRYLAGHLWTPEPAAMLGPLSTSVDKYVKQPSRNTMAYNATRERVKLARVPSGSKTCAFCLTLASRDVVYLSERSAALRSDSEKYHGHCDCQPVRIKTIDDYPDGYDPGSMYEMYKDARNEAGSGDVKDIAASMRRMFPDSLTDGVHTH